jgi:hypothetical protein
MSDEPTDAAPLSSTYVKVLVLEAAIIALLWIFGGLYS